MSFNPRPRPDEAFRDCPLEARVKANRIGGLQHLGPLLYGPRSFERVVPMGFAKPRMVYPP